MITCFESFVVLLLFSSFFYDQTCRPFFFKVIYFVYELSFYFTNKHIFINLKLFWGLKLNTFPLFLYFYKFLLFFVSMKVLSVIPIAYIFSFYSVSYCSGNILVKHLVYAQNWAMSCRLQRFLCIFDHIICEIVFSLHLFLYLSLVMFQSNWF